MRLTLQKRLAATILKCSEKKVKFDSERLDEVKEAITKADIRRLVKDKAVSKKETKESSKVRARIRKVQRRKGRQRGAGSRKGKRTSRLSRKTAWIQKIRTQRLLLQSLKEKGLIKLADYHLLYKKSKGGFFRSRRHIKLYIDEHGLSNKK